MVVILSIGAAITANITEGPAAWAAAVFSALLLALYMLVEFGSPAWRRFRLKNSFVAKFTIPAIQMRLLDYVIQDDKEHQTKELILTSNSQVEIEILFSAPASTRLSEYYFGCLGAKGDLSNESEERAEPRAIASLNKFMVRGPGEETSESNKSNYTDHHALYHVRRDWPLVKNETYSIGFKLETRQPGTYRAVLHLVGDEIKAVIDDLTIIVADRPTAKMKCIRADHRWDACFISPKIKT